MNMRVRAVNPGVHSQKVHGCRLSLQPESLQPFSALRSRSPFASQLLRFWLITSLISSVAVDSETDLETVPYSE